MSQGELCKMHFRYILNPDCSTTQLSGIEGSLVNGDLSSLPPSSVRPPQHDAERHTGYTSRKRKSAKLSMSKIDCSFPSASLDGIPSPPPTTPDSHHSGIKLDIPSQTNKLSLDFGHELPSPPPGYSWILAPGALQACLEETRGHMRVAKGFRLTPERSRAAEPLRKRNFKIALHALCRLAFGQPGDDWGDEYGENLVLQARMLPWVTPFASTSRHPFTNQARLADGQKLDAIALKLLSLERRGLPAGTRLADLKPPSSAEVWAWGDCLARACDRYPIKLTNTNIANIHPDDVKRIHGRYWIEGVDEPST